MWYKYGKLHRINGPALIERLIDRNKTTESWYKNGKRHRDGELPAVIIHYDGSVSKRWYKNGKLHRINGPAVIGCNGSQLWYKNGVPGKSIPVFVRKIYNFLNLS